MADSFEHFFKTNYRDVEGRVRAAGASTDVAAEATQEAFVRAYQRWWRVARLRNPAAWVQRVALNHRVDIERRTGRTTTLVAPIVVDNDSEAAIDATMDPAIESAVAALPPRQQAAVQAVYADGKTPAETASDLGISPGTVRFHLHQARSTLRPMLASDTAGQEV